MPFAKIVRDGVALANTLTASLQDSVTYEPWIASDGFGQHVYGSPQQIPAIIERQSKMIIDLAGQEIRAEHVINILRPIPANGAAGRDEPIDARDRFTLADGSTGIIAAVETLVDPAISAGYYHIVSIGRKI